MSTAVLRPNWVDAWNMAGNGPSVETTVANLSDNNTQTNIYFTEGQYCILAMGTVAMPAGSVVTAVSQSMWAMNLHGGTVKCRIYRYGTWSAVPEHGLTTGQVYTLSSTASDSGGNWPTTQGAIDSYQVAVDCTQWGQGGVYILDVWMDVAYQYPPTTTITGPTTVRGSSATITWTYSRDPSSSPQNYYWVRVFSPAQYNIGGFNPDNSPATYDTGWVNQPSSTHTVTGLTTGSWRVYVRVTVPLPGYYAGQNFASAWAARDITVTLPRADSWGGSSFQTGGLKRWNGSSFVDVLYVKKWNGSSFVQTPKG